MKKWITLFVLVSLIIATPAYAQSYKVVKGDTLSSIAKKNKVTVRQIMSANKLKSTNIRIGQIIHIPTKYKAVKKRAVSKVSRSDDRWQQKMQTAIDSAIGTPYRYGGTTLNGFDCSGFTSYVFKQVGQQLPRDSRSQFTVGDRIDRDNMEYGDLIFFSARKNGVISHVGIYLGNNKMAHAASGQRYVKVNDLSWYYNNYQLVGIKRVMED